MTDWVFGRNVMNMMDMLIVFGPWALVLVLAVICLLVLRSNESLVAVVNKSWEALEESNALIAKLSNEFNVPKSKSDVGIESLPAAAKASATFIPEGDSFSKNLSPSMFNEELPDITFPSGTPESVVAIQDEISLNEEAPVSVPGNEPLDDNAPVKAFGKMYMVE